jgi:hypothetical protein
MKIFVITRLSYIANADFKAISSKHIDEYKKILFNKNRLDEKFNAFKKITHPSIINQTYNNWMWFIITSKFLPDNYKKILNDIINNNPRIKVIFSENGGGGFQNYKKYIVENENYATMRLDDDDGINIKLFKKLQTYDNSIYNNKYITFPLGQRYTIKNNVVILGSKYNSPKVALGLTRINNYVYKTQHNKIPNNNLIIDNFPNSYLLYCGNATYTKRNFY